MPSSPYSTKFLSGEIDHAFNPDELMKKYKKEEKETHPTPNILPYEFGDLPILYANIIENAMHASQILENALKNQEITHKKELSKLKKNTEKMIVYLVKNVDPTLEQQTIGHKHLDDEDEKYEELG